MNQGEVLVAPAELQEGNITVVNGKVMQKLNGVLEPLTAAFDSKTGKPSAQLTDRAKMLVGLREATHDLINTMKTAT